MLRRATYATPLLYDIFIPHHLFKKKNIYNKCTTIQRRGVGGIFWIGSRTKSLELCEKYVKFVADNENVLN